MIEEGRNLRLHLSDGLQAPISRARARVGALRQAGWLARNEPRGLGGYDILTAGHARSRGLVVLTTNLT